MRKATYPRMGHYTEVFELLARGMGLERLRSPYIFQGATAMNEALVRCFEEEIKEEIIVPQRPDLMGAIGIALLTKEEFKGDTSFKGFESIRSDFTTRTYYGKKCTNQCEITQVLENQELIGHVGNRCDKCAKAKTTIPSMPESSPRLSSTI